MKKRISCILLICLILGVCACNAREEESVQEEKTEITAVFLAQGALNLEVGEKFQQNCTVIPEEADMSGLSAKGDGIGEFLLLHVGRHDGARRAVGLRRSISKVGDERGYSGNELIDRERHSDDAGGRDNDVVALYPELSGESRASLLRVRVSVRRAGVGVSAVADRRARDTV